MQDRQPVYIRLAVTLVLVIGIMRGLDAVMLDLDITSETIRRLSRLLAGLLTGAVFWNMFRTWYR